MLLRSFLYSFSFEQIRLALIPNPYGIAYFVVFGWSDVACRYRCLSVGFLYIKVVMFPSSIIFLSYIFTSRNSIVSFDDCRSTCIFLCMLFAVF